MYRSTLLRCPLCVALFITTVPAPGQPAAQNRVYVRVYMPIAHAQLTVQDSPAPYTGSIVNFYSPLLESGRSYVYTLAATWEPNNYTTIIRTRKIVVRAGQEIEVDLRKPDEKHPDSIRIRYVPTPPGVVDAMLNLAEVGKEDVVYDLGCGDGRIVITSVKKFGANRGIGVDIDPKRIKESKANAEQNGVEDRVEFRHGDVLEIGDLVGATVVTLYLSEAMNLRLRSILQKTLKPGSRVVSHRWTMGDWKPLKTQTLIDRNGEKYLIHLWRVSEDDAK